MMYLLKINTLTFYLLTFMAIKSQFKILHISEFICFLRYKPKEWLFEGVDGQQYSESSIYTIVKKAFKMAGIKKKASLHTLRHCFGTHLLENGTDLRYIQALMGHESSKTTEIYTHITTKGFDQIVNPMD